MTYTVTNLSTLQEDIYMEDVPRKQALKTSYAMENNLSSRLATDFGRLMNDLENEIVDAKHFWSLGDFTVKKEIYA